MPTTLALRAMIAAAVTSGSNAGDPPARLAQAHAVVHGVTISEELWSRLRRMSPLPAPPPDPTNRVADAERAAALGQRLFFDAGLSSDGRTSCASCHDPAQAFTDRRALREGLRRNVPTLLNVAQQRWWFWDGRADSLWSQALQPIEAPNEMHGSRLAVVQHLRADVGLRDAYEGLFGPLPPLPDGSRSPTVDRLAIDVVFSNVGKAIAAYERRLVDRSSPFDRFVGALADRDAGKAEKEMSAAAVQGLLIFTGKGGCSVCHDGPQFSDGEFHDLGLRQPTNVEPDLGRLAGLEQLKLDPFNAAGVYSSERDGKSAQRLRYLAARAELAGAFKTPSLRNVARTPPYAHDGRFGTLAEVLRFYSTLEGQRRSHHGDGETILVPLGLSAAQIAQLEAFLGSLSGDPLPAGLLAKPDDDAAKR